MDKPTFFQKLISYIYPVRIRKSSGRHHRLLELFIYKGQYQLGTTDALYSDGHRYRPLRLAFHTLDKDAWKSIQQVVFLGAGIGSGVQILHHMGHHPHCTLVDTDDTILKWAKEILSSYGIATTTICHDAKAYIAAQQPAAFDMLVVDIFNGRVVPAFATQAAFLQQCRRAIKPGGYFVMNYIVADVQEWDAALVQLIDVFPHVQVLEEGVNRILITQV